MSAIHMDCHIGYGNVYAGRDYVEELFWELFPRDVKMPAELLTPAMSLFSCFH